MQQCLCGRGASNQAMATWIFVKHLGICNGVILTGISKNRAKELLCDVLRLCVITGVVYQEYPSMDEMRCDIYFCVCKEALPALLVRCIDKYDLAFSSHCSIGYFSK